MTIQFCRVGLIVGAAMIAPSLASANTISAWNLDNVVAEPTPADDVTGFSVIYQGDPSTAETNGRIAFTPPEAVSPGLVALNDPYTTGQGTFDGCIRADVGGVECATGFQTGNRFKLQLTDTGAVDLVFDVDHTLPGDSLYQVFGRAVNLTTQMLNSFIIELGYGVGDGFTGSSAGDGLGFAQSLALGPDNLTAFTQYPFGLFGDAPTTNTDLDGFFDDARTGFDLLVGEDMLTSAGFYGTYDDRFGTWLSREMAPSGLLWDEDNDPATDSLVMAWLREDGLWEVLRDIDGSGDPFSILNAPLVFADVASVEGYFGFALDFEQNIEDLANLNLNFGILLGDNYGLDSFTLRLTSFAAVAPVPLPASMLLLLAGVGGLGALRRFRKPATA